jgi:hypothetical protein
MFRPWAPITQGFSIPQTSLVPFQGNPGVT